MREKQGYQNQTGSELHEQHHVDLGPLQSNDVYTAVLTDRLMRTHVRNV